MLFRSSVACLWRQASQSVGMGHWRQTRQVDQLRQNIRSDRGTWEPKYTDRHMNDTAPEPSVGDIHHKPPTHDAVACRRWWNGVDEQAQPAWLHEEVARRMQERLTWIKLQPRDWVHAQPSIGGFDAHQAIAQRYPKATSYFIEPSVLRSAISRERLGLRGWQRLNPWKSKPLELKPDHWPDQVDMIWANMQLHLHADPQALLQQWHRALRVDGFVMFSCLGPDSLKIGRAHV